MRNLVLVAVLSMGIISATPTLGQVTVRAGAQVEMKVESKARSSMEEFALGKLKQVLAEAGSRLGQGEPPVTVVLRIAPGVPQSYSIHRDKHLIAVTGGDDRGLMYGILRLAEEVKLGIPLDRVREETKKPYVLMRAFKFNLPLPGTRYLSPSSLKNNQWFTDLDYWRKFLDHLAEDRFDVLEFWSAEPWGQMVSLKKYPEGTSLSPEEMRRHIHFFHTLFHMAKVRGIDTYLVTWNIDLDPAFASAHHIPAWNYGSPLVRDYLRDCVRTTLITYPELTGLGTTQGEQMGVVPVDKRGDWIADVYFRAIQESGRKNVPFIFRYWGGTPADTEKAAAAYSLGPVYLDIKYNGEDVYSSPMYHVQNSAWLTQKHTYQFLWHLRNDQLFSFRWGNPEFVRELMRNMKRTNPAGFTYGSEEDIPGPENYDTPSARAHQPWPYKFQKQWFMLALWGRLGYNPDVSDRVWREYFRYEYGSAGYALYDCTVAASRIAPLITSFHWNYMNGDWMPEGSIGSWNTSAEQPRPNYRRFQMYHGILDYVFNNTIDSHYENIIQYVALTLGRERPVRNTASPLDVANDLEQDGHEALNATLIPFPDRVYVDRFRAAQSDDEAYGRLALYYAEKVRGAADLGLFIFTDKPSYQAAAVTHLKKSLAEWQRLVEITGNHYLPREIWTMGVFDWSMYTSAVEHDLAIAQSVRPVTTYTQKWQFQPVFRATGSSETAARKFPSWSTVTLHEKEAFGAAGLFPWLLYGNSLFSAPEVEPLASKFAAQPGFRGIVAYRWKIALPSARRGEEWVIAIPGSEKASVTFNGRPIKLPGLLHARTRRTFTSRNIGYQIYPLGSQGTVKIELPPGIVPEVAQVARPSVASMDLSAQTGQVTSPLKETVRGVQSMPDTADLPAFTASDVRTEVNPAGSVLFHFHTAVPGFYRIECLLHAGKYTKSLRAFFAVDQFNGVDNSLFPSRLSIAKTAKAPAKGWRVAREAWAIPLGVGEHTLRIYLRQPGLEVKQARLISAIE